MSRKTLILIAAMALLLPTAALADRCAVPLADWQPREALKARLEQAGWQVLKIGTDDGCYKVMAIDGSGNPVRGRFDPATLERLERGEHGERGGHGRHGRRGGSDDETD